MSHVSLNFITLRKLETLSYSKTPYSYFSQPIFSWFRNLQNHHQNTFPPFLFFSLCIHQSISLCLFHRSAASFLTSTYLLIIYLLLRPFRSISTPLPIYLFINISFCFWGQSIASFLSSPRPRSFHTSTQQWQEHGLPLCPAIPFRSPFHVFRYSSTSSTIFTSPCYLFFMSLPSGP